MERKRQTDGRGRGGDGVREKQIGENNRER